MAPQSHTKSYKDLGFGFQQHQEKRHTNIPKLVQLSLIYPLQQAKQQMGKRMERG